MKKLLIIFLLFNTAFAQLPAGKYLKVKDDGSGFELFTLTAVPGARLADSTATLRAWMVDNYATSNHTHTGVYQPVGSYLVAADIAGKQTTLVSGTNIKTVNGTTLLGSGDLSTTQTTVSGNAGTATTLQTSRNINGVAFNGSADITVDNDLLAYAALGSPILCQTVNQRLEYSNTSTALVDGQIKYEAIYLPKAATLTGLKVYVRVLGNYTGDNNNRVGLYSYSGGTLTLVASSTNSGTLWTSAANAIQTIPFSSTYNASAGLYFAAFLYNNSAQTTAPALASGVALNNLAMGSTAMGFTNSAKLHGTSSGTDLPSSIAMSSITASTIPSWVGGY